ncbi:MAG: hypothetical protein ACO3UU_04910, partial [Minisyncoccia bacterium]
MKLGFTFSIKYCQDIGLNWQQTLRSILEAYPWEYIRLPIYWDTIEVKKDIIDYSLIKEQLEIIYNYKIKVIPVIGYRNPRWPERHGPDWLDNIPINDFNKEVLKWSEKCILELKSNTNISHWQIENEPLENNWGKAGFDVDKIYHEELKLLKSLDSRDCLITYGFKPWDTTFSGALKEDIVGLDIYSKLGVKKFGKVWYPDMFYLPDNIILSRIRRDIRFVEENKAQIWITELQAEPWDAIDKVLFDKNKWMKTITPDRFSKLLNLAVKSGIVTILVWGVEWWWTLDKKDRAEFISKLPIN